jgi:hypothetical protein
VLSGLQQQGQIHVCHSLLQKKMRPNIPNERTALRLKPMASRKLNHNVFCGTGFIKAALPTFN